MSQTYTPMAASPSSIVVAAPEKAVLPIIEPNLTPTKTILASTGFHTAGRPHGTGKAHGSGRAHGTGKAHGTGVPHWHGTAHGTGKHHGPHGTGIPQPPGYMS